MHSAVKKYITLLLFLPMLVAIPLGTSAQENTSADLTNEMVSIGGGVSPPNTVSCFDYYRFGSIRTEVSLPVSSVVSGSVAQFAGYIHNDNPYPVVDGALYVKVFRNRLISDANGPDVVGEFLVKTGISIPAKDSMPISFTWNVPIFMEKGEYALATYFTTSRKFNLSGLSFTDDIVGTRAPFRIGGETVGGVRFDKAKVRVEGDSYRFASFPPRVSATSSVEVAATVMNTTKKDEAASISWRVYRWDSQLRENVVQEVETREIKVPAGASVPVSVVVTDTAYPVYYAVGTVKWRDTTSLIGVRFVREGVERLRVNFPGVTSYPLTAGVPTQLFSCLHNEGMAPLVSGGKLELSLTAPDGTLIHSYVYEGDVSSAMMGVVTEFTPTHNYDNFYLDARLYRDNEFVDEAHLEYYCNELQGGVCVASETQEAGFFSYVAESEHALLYVLLLLAGAFSLVGVLAWIVRRFMRLTVPTTPEPIMNDSNNTL